MNKIGTKISYCLQLKQRRNATDIQKCLPKITYIENVSLGKMQQMNIKTKMKTTKYSHSGACKCLAMVNIILSCQLV